MAEIGIHSENRDALQERCLISTGLTLVEPVEAERRGYYASEIAQIILPATLPRPATTEELDAITAGPDTKRVMQLVRLPRLIGARLLQGCNQNEFGAFDEHAPYQEIAPGIRGQCMDSRLDDANQPTVSVNLKDINQFTGRPSKVGDHMDTWENPDLSLLIGNMGPGEHWHHLVPEFNRDTAGGPQIADRVRFMKAHPDPSSIPVYWFQLRAPGDDYVEALLNAPVAYAMHDGSTLGCPEPSTAFFCAIDPVGIGEYPSPLAT